MSISYTHEISLSVWGRILKACFCMNVRLLTQRNLCKVQDVIHGLHSICACSLNGNGFKWSHSQLCSTAQVTCTCETAIWENQNLTETAWKVWPRVRRALSAFSCPSTPSCHHQVSLSFYSVQALLEQVSYWLKQLELLYYRSLFCS